MTTRHARFVRVLSVSWLALLAACAGGGGELAMAVLSPMTVLSPNGGLTIT